VDAEQSTTATSRRAATIAHDGIVDAGSRFVIRRSTRQISGVKVFAATRPPERDQLGDRVTAWLRSNQEFAIEDIVVAQSSDDTHHCLTIVVFYRERAQRK
jgi:hypothetical protein